MSVKKFFQIIVLFSIGLIFGIILTYFIFIKNSFIFNEKYINPVLGRKLINFEDKIWTSNDLPYDLFLEYSIIENNYYKSLKNFAEKLALSISMSQDLRKDVNSNFIPKLKDLIKIEGVKETDAKKYYDNLVSKYGTNIFGGQAFDKAKQQLLFQLNNEKIASFSNNKIEELINIGKLRLLFESPLGIPANIDYSLFPKRGNLDSNITFISVIDFIDHKSRDIHPEIEEMYKKFSRKIRFINIPYSNLQNSLNDDFAKGAFCANEQGNTIYWDFYKKSFEFLNKYSSDYYNKEIKNLNNIVLSVAKSTDLKMDKFSLCLNSNRTKEIIIRTHNLLNESTEFKGAPAFYLNKRFLLISLKEIDKIFNNF
ncbi:hypothetical protein GCL60_01475 [Silvanigrella paludirubra]|uniref:Thioredoxin domain-containing protein n=1 Tax=Silvanigrella paludirubra TaxID=2499159 RepID=A0A6N6VX83_9BACT|nr:thioredoxin domain-containing protein [Silvanigrella paludirubra]KAB8040619.1 hypothetical protein GCL60_01475 [Silvanigrella paludirubra]